MNNKKNYLKNMGDNFGNLTFRTIKGEKWSESANHDMPG